MGIASGNPHGGKGGGAWMWLDPAVINKIRIAEEDPEHPEHWLHVKRTSDAEFSALLNSMRVLRMTGMANAKPIEIYLDGKVSTVADGRRTICALRIINAESKPADRLSVRATTTKDPGVARDVNNANHAKDPPLILARRFVAAYTVDGNKLEAAARQGLTLKEANALEKCLALPEDLQAKINRLEIPTDVALRLYANGGAEAKAAIADVTGADGKIDAGKARDKTKRKAPAKIDGPPPLRPATLKAVTGDLDATDTLTQKEQHVLAGLQLAAGDMTVLDSYPGVREAFERQRIDTATGHMRPGRKAGAK